MNPKMGTFPPSEASRVGRTLTMVGQLSAPEGWISQWWKMDTINEHGRLWHNAHCWADGISETEIFRRDHGAVK